MLRREGASGGVTRFGRREYRDGDGGQENGGGAIADHFIAGQRSFVRFVVRPIYFQLNPSL